MKNTIKLIALAALIVLVTACKPPIADPPAELPNRRIERHVDLEAGVVCWTMNYAYDKGGISCLPIEQTKLGE